MMLGTVEFENSFERPMLLDLLEKYGNLPDYFAQSRALRVRSHSHEGSPFPRYFEVSPNLKTTQHDERRKLITNTKTHVPYIEQIALSDKINTFFNYPALT